MLRIMLALLGLAGVVVILVLLTRSPHEAQRNAAEQSCQSRMQAASSFDTGIADDKSADKVTLRFIRLDQFRMEVLDASGCWRLVNFWATWCEPCREEMPALARLADRFRGQGLEVITVNLEPPQTGDAAHRFLRDYQVNAINLRLDVPDTRTIAEWLEGRWVGGIPFTMIINPGGEWHFWQHGLFDVDEVEQQLERVLPSREPAVAAPAH